MDLKWADVIWRWPNKLTHVSCFFLQRKRFDSEVQHFRTSLLSDFFLLRSEQRDLFQSLSKRETLLYNIIIDQNLDR